MNNEYHSFIYVYIWYIKWTRGLWNPISFRYLNHDHILKKVEKLFCFRYMCSKFWNCFLKVLQEQLIKAERERILQEIKSGALTADTGKKLLKKIDEEVEESDDKIPPTLAKRLKNGHQTSTTTTTKYSKSSSKNQGGRK